MKHLTSKRLLFLILVLAFLFRFWNISNQDILGDEAADSFRAIGYLDYLGTSFQTQPIDWYADHPLPWWTKLSFHDFPPLAMLIQHLFFRIFGDSILVAKLPSILAGLGSILLLYLISLRLFSIDPRSYLRESASTQKFALLVAFLASINSVFVSIFRTSLLEPILLFFILLNIYLFFRFLENRRYWWAFGGTFGLVMLTKYTGVFLVPVYLSYLIFDAILGRSDVPKIEKSNSWRLCAAFLISFFLFSPVIIYNIYLYKETGHFDLQIAYLLGQNTPEWSGLLGKIQSPFSDIWKNLTAFYGIPFLLAVLMGFAYSTYKTYQSYQQIRENPRSYPRLSASIFIGLYLLFATLLFTKIGVANRFLTLYTPAFIILTAQAINYLWNFSERSDIPKIEKSNIRTSDLRILKVILKILVVVFIIFEIWFSINKNFFQVENYGIAALDNYFEQEFKGKESAVIPESDNRHLNDVIYKFAKQKSKGEREFFMLVYNDNIVLPTLEWIFYRRFFYHSIPTLYTENFVKALQTQGPDYFKNFQIYFVQSTENTELNSFKKENTAGKEFEERLLASGVKPEKIIYGQNNLEMFKIYKFNL